MAGRPVPLGPLVALTPSHAAATMARRRPASQSARKHAEPPLQLALHVQPGDPASDVTLFQAAAAALPSLSPHALAAAIVAAGRQQMAAQHQQRADAAAAAEAAAAAQRRRQQQTATSAAAAQSASTEVASSFSALTDVIMQALSSPQAGGLLSHPLFAGLLMQVPQQQQQFAWPPTACATVAGPAGLAVALPQPAPAAAPGVRAFTEADIISALSELAANGAAPSA